VRKALNKTNPVLTLHFAFGSELPLAQGSPTKVQLNMVEKPVLFVKYEDEHSVLYYEDEPGTAKKVHIQNDTHQILVYLFALSQFHRSCSFIQKLESFLDPPLLNMS
jgi:hypothetical protein